MKCSQSPCTGRPAYIIRGLLYCKFCVLDVKAKVSEINRVSVRQHSSSYIRLQSIDRSEFFSIDDTARELGILRQSVYTYISAGRFPAYIYEFQVFMKRSDITNYKQTHTSRHRDSKPTRI